MKGVILWCVVIEEKMLFLLNLQIVNLQIEACSSTIECFSFHGNTFTSGFLPPLKIIEGKMRFSQQCSDLFSCKSAF